MSYSGRFVLIEDYLTHTDSLMASIGDPFIESRYLGFIVTAAVTAYELAIKDIFYDFSDKKHKVLGNFARANFDRINGRIKIQSLRDDHVAMFGDKYVDSFKKKLADKEEEFLRAGRGSVRSSYTNVITWRHGFVHSGAIPSTTNYNEVKRAYSVGKEVVHCVASAMVR
jgi:hypothetical protein